MKLLLKFIVLFLIFTYLLSAQTYNRKDYNVWKNYKCNTRDLILIRDNYEKIYKGNICDNKEGKWLLGYSNEFVTNSSLIDLDHIIPIKYAHDMGAYRWSKKNKQLFANDLDNLILSSKKENRTKQDNGPSQWMPKYNRCEYSLRWKEISNKYNLTIKPEDLIVIENTITEECK